MTRAQRHRERYNPRRRQGRRRRNTAAEAGITDNSEHPAPISAHPA